MIGLNGMAGGGGFEDDAIGVEESASFWGCFPFCLLLLPLGVLSEAILLLEAEAARFEAAETAAARLGGAIFARFWSNFPFCYWYNEEEKFWI